MELRICPRRVATRLLCVSVCPQTDVCHYLLQTSPVLSHHTGHRARLFPWTVHFTITLFLLGYVITATGKETKASANREN